MPRAALLLASLFLALLALVRPVDAQLRTFCNAPNLFNPEMSFCASFWANDLLIRRDGWSVWTVDVELFGPGYDDAPFTDRGSGPGSGGFLLGGPVIGCETGWSGDNTIPSAGRYIFEMTTTTRCDRFGDGDEIRVAGHDPLELFGIGWLEGAVAGRCSPREGTCQDRTAGGQVFAVSEPVSVPEPASMLLLATGLVGLGVAHRRRH